MSTFPTATETVDGALLLGTLPNLGVPHFLTPVIITAVTAARHRLVIVLFSRHFNSHIGSDTNSKNASIDPEQDLSHTRRWDDVQRLLTFVYVQATKIAQDRGKLLMEIDVLLKGMDDGLPSNIGVGKDLVFRVDGDAIAVPLPLSIMSLQQHYLPPGSSDPTPDPTTPPESSPSSTLSNEPEASPSLFPVAALGGTFDHLHAGHKILLSMGAWITKEKLIVGVTDDALLTKKEYKEVLEPLETRIDRVRGFLTLFKPSLVYDIVPIKDVYGPTGWDPNVQALVVSKETMSGAKSIATHRASQSLPPLQTFIIDVISPNSSNLAHEDAELLKQTKMSSTFIREWIVANKKKLENN